MIWVPPPTWIIAIMLAFVAHVAVIAAVFYARGWRRGAVAIPVGFVAFVVSVIAGAALDAAVWQLDPLPLLVLLSAGVYGTYAILTRSPAANHFATPKQG